MPRASEARSRAPLAEQATVTPRLHVTEAYYSRRGTMKKLTIVALSTGMLLASSAAFAQTAAPSPAPMAPSGTKAEILTSVPAGVTVTDWYKQSVYDPSNSKIGEIMDVLVTPEGKVSALIIGVGGFLGA